MIPQFIKALDSFICLNRTVISREQARDGQFGAISKIGKYLPGLKPLQFALTHEQTHRMAEANIRIVRGLPTLNREQF